MSAVKRLGIVAVATWLAAAPAWADRIETVDGRRVEGQIAALDAETVTVIVDDAEQTIARAEIASLTFERAGGRGQGILDRPEQVVVETIAGDRLAVVGIVSDGDAVQLTGAQIGRVSLALDRVRSICIPGQGQRPAEVYAAADEARLTAETQDRLLAVNDEGATVPVAGTFKSIRLDPPDTENGEWGDVDWGDDSPNGEIVFTWNQDDRTLPIGKVRLLRLALTAAEPAASAGRVFCADGSALRFDTLAVVAGLLTLDSPELGELSLVRTHVLRVEFHSDRVVYLSDLESTHVVERGLMDHTFTYRADQAVSGEPIVLDGQTYDRGLGLHSFCELTYALDGEYAIFAATVGIDDAARPNGDATLTILTDGQVHGDPIRLTGQHGAGPLRFDIPDVRTLTFRVDFGQDQLDVADHVDLAEARLIR